MKLLKEMKTGPNRSIEVMISWVVQVQQWLTENKWKGYLRRL